MPSLLCLHFTVSLVAVFFVVAVTCFVVCLNMLWHFAEMCVKGFKPLKSTSLSVCVFFSFSITLVCSFPDVRMDTSALDAYRLSHCGCTCPILSKVCSNDMSSWQQRHSCHWITSVDSCCPPHPPHSPPPHQISSSFSSSSSFSGQHALSCALHHAHDGVIQREHSASAVCRCSVVLILCLSSSLPLSLPPLLPPLPFFLTFSYSHCPFHSTLSPSIFFLSLTLSPPSSSSSFSLSSALFLSIRCPNDFTGDRCQTYVMASFYRMSISSSVTVSLSSCHACMLGVETALISCYYLIVLSVSALVTHSQAGID